MSKFKNRTDNQRHPLPFRATPNAAEAKEKVMKLLERKGIFLSNSDLLKAIMRPCFAPHVPYHQQIGHSVIYEPVPKGELKRFLTPRFVAWARPLIENKEVIVRLGEFPNGMWTFWLWISYEYLFSGVGDGRARGGEVPQVGQDSRQNDDAVSNGEGTARGKEAGQTAGT